MTVCPFSHLMFKVVVAKLSSIGHVVLLKISMTSFLKSALLAITAGFLGLTICTQVRSQDQSQDRLNLNEPIALEFQSFFKMPIGPKGLEVSEKVLNASGKKVRLTGYMVQHEISPLGAFILAPRPVQMSEHADGDANDLPASICWIILDETQKNLSVPHIPGKVIVE